MRPPDPGNCLVPFDAPQYAAIRERCERESRFWREDERGLWVPFKWVQDADPRTRMGDRR